MKPLVAAIFCWTIAIWCAWIMIGCAGVEHKPMPEGEQTQAPFGYIIFCIENPDSPFCKEVDE